MKFVTALSIFSVIFQFDSASATRIQRSILAANGHCPGGEPLGIPCDAKRPWPQCPPQSYCFATNSVDTGPYCCCPVWSTMGAGWRPSGPSYPYYPPMPENWPHVIRATANWGAATNQYAGNVKQFGALLELLQHRYAKHHQPNNELVKVEENSIL